MKLMMTISHLLKSPMNEYPSIVEYRRALADPKSAFIEDFLADGEVGVDQLGLPQMSSGGFACLTTVKTDSENTWVVRLFMRPQSELPRRYRAVVEQMPCDCLLEAYYLEDGICVSGYDRNFPIVIIRFTEGPTLRSFLCNACRKNDTNAIRELRDSFNLMKSDLQVRNLIHGDLSPDNLIVQCKQKTRIKLVDYDNCWHPSCGKLSSNVGKSAFQRRQGFRHIDPRFDDLSFAIYESVFELLETDPEWGIEDDLYEQQLLISIFDLEFPESSEILSELRKIAPVSYQKILDLYNSKD